MDLPRISKALEPKEECDDASSHVSLQVENNIVVCVWQWSHFDFGVRWEDAYDREHGYHMKTICNRLLRDCVVSRVGG